MKKDEKRSINILVLLQFRNQEFFYALSSLAYIWLEIHKNPYHA
jgi:hypothetical protein